MERPEHTIEELEREVAELRAAAEEARAALRQRERQIDALRRTSEALYALPSVDAMLGETLALAIDVMDADAGSILMHNPADDTMVFRHVLGPIAERLQGMAMPVAGITGRVFRSAQPVLIPRAQDDPEQRRLEERIGYHAESIISVPLKRMTTGAPFGTMQILNGQRPFDEGDLEVLLVLSASAASAIEQARLAEEARKAEVASLIGDVSHDIKNLLTPIQSGVWTLQPLLEDLFSAWETLGRQYQGDAAWLTAVEAALEPVRADHSWILESALEAADRVQARTKEIADAVKGETSPPFFEAADLNATAREVARPLELVAHKGGISLLLDLDPDLPPVQLDRKQIYNALYNLVNNAIPETPRGGSVTLRTRGPAPGETCVIVEVADTGRGIPEHVRARLFTDAAVSTKPGGTGLGTRIVANVVRRHGGTISVASEDGKGSTFTLCLPIRQASSP